ncbi:PilX N-terminal domain-containing pilus assembly protein [Pseudomonadota bacterium]
MKSAAPLGINKHAGLPKLGKHRAQVSSTQSQRGAALAVSLVFLLVLTIIGINSLGTTSLEERMSGNLQEQNRAFQAAESGVVRVISIAEVSGTNLNTSQDGTDETAINDLHDANSRTTTSTKFLQTTTPGRTTDTAHGQGTASFNHFDIESDGETNTKARVTINQGIKFLGGSDSGIFRE